MTRRVVLVSVFLTTATVLSLALTAHLASRASASDTSPSLALGGAHSCAVTFETTVQCWGENSSGQLGDGSTDSSLVPVDVCEPFFLAGGTSCCPVIILGSEEAGVPPACQLTGVRQVAAGFAHTCGLTISGSVKCWGDNAIGQLGDGTDFDSSLPIDVCDLSSVIILGSFGGPSSCCPILLGSLVEALPQLPPSSCEALDGITQISAGAGHTCALRETGGVWCWGNNSSGQLGDGTDSNSNVPVGVCASGPVILGTGPAGFGCIPLTGAASIDAGNEHTCAVLEDSSVVCWGSNINGQLGDGTTEDRWLPTSVCEEGSFLAGGPPACCPVVVPGVLPACYLTNAVAASAGGDHTCALMADTSVLCWGFNQHGEVGDGTTGDRNVPTQVCGELLLAGGGPSCCLRILSTGTAGVALSCPIFAGVDSIAAGYRHTCAVVTDGRLTCWGLGESGQLGHGSPADSTTIPIAICDKLPAVAGVLPSCGTLADVSAVGAGWSHSCAITNDKRVLCWGANVSGELGTGLDTSSSVPLEVVGFPSKNTPTPGVTSAPEATPTNTQTPPASATNTPTSTATAPSSTSTPTPSPGLTADANCNGVVDAIDAALILQLVAGVIDSVPCPEHADVDDNGTISPIDAALILQFVAGLVDGL